MAIIMRWFLVECKYGILHLKHDSKIVITVMLYGYRLRTYLINEMHCWTFNVVNPVDTS